MKVRYAVALLLIAWLVALCAGCVQEPKSFLVKRPENVATDRAVTVYWTNDISRVARDGDWILTRSYYAIADVVAKVTPGEELSHASIYDAKTNTIIEAVEEGVREIPLADLVQRNHYVIVVRPRGMTAAEGTAAVARARSRIGTPFDKRGFVGFDDPDKFYCSELVWWASRGEERTGDHHTLITPAELMDYSDVIYWSGKRDDAQIQALALDAKSTLANQPSLAAR